MARKSLERRVGSYVAASHCPALWPSRHRKAGAKTFETVRKIGISAPTVAKSMQHLLQLGILREVTGRQRHRLFVYQAYLAILNEGTEPL